MATCSTSPTTLTEEINTRPTVASKPEVTVLTGGFDKPYAFGLTMALISKNVRLEVIGSDDVDSPEMHTSLDLNFLNLRGSKKEETGLVSKVSRVLLYYARLLRYATVAKPRIFHILWNDKLEHLDRTLLMLYYKLRRKKIVLTAHNVNAGKRDANDSALNRLTLRIQYQLADHIFVHTDRMKAELLKQFGVNGTAVTVIPFGINNSVPNTGLTPDEAKRRLNLEPGTKTVLFFGAIRPYKGLEHLVSAFLEIARRNPEYRLVIAGAAMKGCEEYLSNILAQIDRHPCRAQVVPNTYFIPDGDTELYFKAADLVALPYVEIFQSGVLFLAYSFGVPVVASDIGSFRDDVTDGQNGFLYHLDEPGGLARTIENYFASDLYKELDVRRDGIRAAAEQAHSWETVGQMTRAVYEQLLAPKRG